MNPHLDSGFDPLQLEQLSPEQRKEVLAHIDVCESCSTEYVNAAEAVAALALTLPPVQPPEALRDRILLDASRSNRFERFVGEASRIADLGVERMSDLLAKIDDLSSWGETPLSGVSVFPLRGGPATADAIVGFIKIKPGTSFPAHGHLGRETALVLQGGCRETSGRIARRGDVVEMEQGMQHEFVALPGPDFVYLAVARGGITIHGTTILASDYNGWLPQPAKSEAARGAFS